MTTPSPADGLRECLALLEKATRGRWSQDTGGDITMDDGTTLFTRELPGGDSDISFANANLVEAAVNFLRDHGPALATALRLREGCEGLVATWRSIANENSEFAAKPDNSDSRRDWHYATSQQADDCADDLARILEEGE